MRPDDRVAAGAPLFQRACPPPRHNAVAWRGRRAGGGTTTAIAEFHFRVRVRFFGHAAELAGCREADVEVGDPRVAGVAEALRRKFPNLRPALDGAVRFAVGTEYADSDTPVSEGDVVSVIPPVAGG